MEHEKELDLKHSVFCGPNHFVCYLFTEPGMARGMWGEFSGVWTKSIMITINDYNFNWRTHWGGTKLSSPEGSGCLPVRWPSVPHGQQGLETAQRPLPVPGLTTRCGSSCCRRYSQVYDLQGRGREGEGEEAIREGLKVKRGKERVCVCESVRKRKRQGRREGARDRGRGEKHSGALF